MNTNQAPNVMIIESRLPTHASTPASASSSTNKPKDTISVVPKKIYQCTQCDHPPYPDPSGLWYHMNSIHSDETEAEKTSRKIKKAAENKTLQER